MQSGQDHLNTISNFCTDPTLTTFLNYFDPIAYARTQHGPLLTILGTHDQFFTVPAINSTYNRIASAGTSERFLKADYDEAEREARRRGRKFLFRDCV